MDQPIKVIIADDHPMVREGLRAVLSRSGDISIVAEASGGEEFLRLAAAVPADVYVLDMAMPGLNGIDAAIRLRKICPKARVIFLTMHGEGVLVERAFKTGARGYVLKENAGEDISRAIKEVHKGGYYAASGISGFLINGLVSGKKRELGDLVGWQALSNREKEVIALIVEGLSDKAIAGRLDISLNTVHSHRTKAMRKLGVHKQTELVRLALSQAIVIP
jgi:DNA-binding NarL/FixJ family response regulator